MILEILKTAIQQNIGSLKQAPKGWNKRNCMLCYTRGHGKDTRNRFGIQYNPQSIAVNCFNCGFSAGYSEGNDLSKGMKLFLKQIQISDEFIKQIEFEIFKQKNNIKEVKIGANEISIEDKLISLFRQWKPVELPKDSLKITEWLENDLRDPNFLRVVNYALSRHIYDLDEFYWSPDQYNNLHQRLIIPYYFKNKIVGFTSRLCYDHDNKDSPKYYQQCPSDFVYNLDNYEGWSRKYVLVNEGVLDAWFVDGISTVGNEIGQEKVDIINRLQKQVIVCPDRDKRGWDLVKIAIDNNWSVAFPKWNQGIKDAAHASKIYGRLLTTHSIISTAISGKDKIKLTWEIEQNERKRERSY